MATDWKDAHVSNKFDLYDDIFEQTLGYPYVYKWLPSSLDTNEQKVILDYGCGPGKVAERFAKQGCYKIIAIDESLESIRIAQSQRISSNIEYRVISNDDLSFIADASLDAAYICFVLLTIGSREQILKILSNIYAKLKPGASCIILDTHPDSVGIRFSSFQVGYFGDIYQDGQLRDAYLFLSAKDKLEIQGFYWSRQFYLSMLTQTGFVDIETSSPTLQKMNADELSVLVNKYSSLEAIPEWNLPPYLIFRGFKKTDPALESVC